MPLEYVSRDRRCRLRCGRCPAQVQGGGRCRNRVCVGLPLCRTHTLRDVGLRVGPSSIPGAGRGVFAAVPFRRGAVICPYGSETVTQRQLDSRYGGGIATYALCAPAAGCQDGACKRGLGSMINGSTGRRTPNVAFRGHGGTIAVVATRRILPGTELVAGYGDPESLRAWHTTRAVRT